MCRGGRSPGSSAAGPGRMTPAGTGELGRPRLASGSRVETVGRPGCQQPDGHPDPQPQQHAQHAAGRTRDGGPLSTPPRAGPPCPASPAGPKSRLVGNGTIPRELFKKCSHCAPRSDPAPSGRSRKTIRVGRRSAAARQAGFRYPAFVAGSADAVRHGVPAYLPEPPCRSPAGHGFPSRRNGHSPQFPQSSHSVCCLSITHPP